MVASHAMRLFAVAAFSTPLLACGPNPAPPPPPPAAEREKLTFDEESRLEFGVAPPPLDEAEIARARVELDRLLPGPGPLFSRYASFQKRFLVPAEKLEDGLKGALGECRRRTRERLDLPAEESVRLQYVSGAAWPSFARYLGGSQSLLLVNRDFPLTASDLLEIASHEAYPGHHVLNVLRERSLGPKRALAAPEGRKALLHEGLASYGLDLLFPGDERLPFERDVLFPLAGLDPSEAQLYSQVAREVRRLAPLRIEAARSYLEGKRDRVQSVLFLENEALVPAPWAFLRFLDRYRTYVITYTLGPDEVRRRLEGRASDPWREFEALVTESNDEA